MFVKKEIINNEIKDSRDKVLVANIDFTFVPTLN